VPLVVLASGRKVRLPEVRVGREHGVRPPEGPLAEYCSVFPERTVEWDVRRQCFAIYQVNPILGGRERVELLREQAGYLLDDEGEPAKDSRGELIPRWTMTPFDYAFVRRRLREWYDLRAEGSARLAGARARRHDRLERQKIRSTAGEMAAGFKDIARWLPALVSGDATDRVPLVPGGLTR
jgi:hypothetical protein